MQRKNFTLDPFGIHWFELDEDLSSEVFSVQALTMRSYCSMFPG